MKACQALPPRPTLSSAPQPDAKVTEPPEPNQTKGAQSLHRAMQLLAAVGEHNVTGIRLTELAQVTGLHVATTHRLLSALVREQMVAFDVHYTKRYFLGLRLHSLVDLARYSALRAKLRDFLAAIVIETRAIAYLYVPLLNDTIALDVVEYPRAPRGLVSEIGRRLPMGIGAGSIALLAAMPDARARALVSANAARYDEYSGLTEAAVWRSIDEARATGYGITLEQVARGFIGVGLVIRNDRGEAEAAVTVVGTLKRMTPAHVEACLEITRRHVAALGPIDLTTPPL